jgi:disulfide bond formation protein DsbB
MNNKSIRPLMLVGLITSLAMIATALFFQYVLYLEPCPLCSVQRAVVILFVILFLIAFVHGPTSSFAKRAYGFLLTLTSLAGLVIAGRHTWLQHLPEDKIPECGPGLDFWINNLPATDVIQKVFQGSGECAEVAWTFLSLSIPEWSIIAFLGFLFFSLRLFFFAK